MHFYDKRCCVLPVICVSLPLNHNKADGELVPISEVRRRETLKLGSGI